MAEQQVAAGTQGLPVEYTVAHACGHHWRWHFFASPAEAIPKAGLAAVLICPRCDGTLREPGDVSYFPTGVCHAHKGPCPDSPHAEWLESLGVRYRRGKLILLGGS